MFINPREEDIDLYLKLYKEDLENVCRYNYLGLIYIDDKLTFNDFVDNKYNLHVFHQSYESLMSS